eukprot:TRINITY_DN23955_c0_g1_i1.p1 TRINITY_DN23955_c0_g1~~TRINITY_DN23955_c0_g1_i1.p1  ORF type:complete len:338 (+),score=115.34 TRINITY_DN23955_c0_g1_i1:35-1048(+)
MASTQQAAPAGRRIMRVHRDERGRPARREGAAPPARRVAPAPLPAIRQVGQLEFLECVGNTAFAQVFKCRVKESGHIVAVKCLSKEVLRQEPEKIRIPTEKAWALEETVHSRLSHPFIVKLHATIDTKEFKYHVMEFCEYGDLANFLGNALGRVPEADVSYWIKQAAFALAFLHKSRPTVIHRDIKLENCLINSRRDLLLSDFGSVGVLLDDSHRRSTLCGTLDYLTPEFVQGRGNTQKSDVWALGVMAYEILTGHPPFAGYADQASTCNAITKQKVHIPENFTPECQSFLQATLERNEEERLTMEQVCSHPFLTMHHSDFALPPPRPEQLRPCEAP